MAIKAVAFDYGQVISLPPEPGTVEKLSALSGIPVEILRELDRKHRANLLDRGTCDAREYYRRFFSFAGLPVREENLEEMALTDIAAWKRVNEETVALMREIKKLGYKTAILSNMPHDFLEIEQDAVRVFDLCSPCIFSCHYNFIKPEQQIYQVLIDALGCVPNEIIFFDDIPVNIEGAQSAGITAYVWQGAKKARGILKTLGILR